MQLLGFQAFSTTCVTCACDPAWPYHHDHTDWQTFLPRKKRQQGLLAESVMYICVYCAIGAIKALAGTEGAADEEALATSGAAAGAST